MIASTYTKLEGTPAAAMMRLLEAIEDLDDTQNCGQFGINPTPSSQLITLVE